MMAMTPVSITGILDKIQSRDKDFRYMATSDLQNELQKPGFKVDENSEKRLCTAILQQLEDVSGDISALAVKCLGLMVRTVSKDSVTQLVTALAEKLVSGKKDQERDIASIALKTAVAEIPPGSDPSGFLKLASLTLLDGLSKEETDIVSNSLEVLHDLIVKFGNRLVVEHPKLKNGFLPLLEDGRAGVRKRTIHCLGALATYMVDSVLGTTVRAVLTRLQVENLSVEQSQVYVQALGTLAHAANWRFSPYLDASVPLAVRYCEGAGEGEDELQEACIQALESFVLCSPHEVQRHVPAIFRHVIGRLSYDPNYSDDMEEDGEDEAAEDEEGYSDEGYSDDEDTSWKVRRAAARALAVVLTRSPALLPDMYSTAAQALIARFREREENVKVDVFKAFVDLIRQVSESGKREGPQAGPLTQLRSDVPAIVRATARQLRDKSVKTRSGCFHVLMELVTAQPDATAEGFKQLVPGVIAALEDKSSSASTLKIQALQFISQTLRDANSLAWQPEIRRLGPPVFAAATDRYYKVAAAALRMCEALVPTIRPSPPAPPQPGLQDLIMPLFHALQPKLAAQDQDQEVKEAAIACAAAAVAGLGDVAGDIYPAMLKVLLDRLRNDITRLPAVKAFTQIAQSPLQLSLEPHAQVLLPELISFLRKANRALRQASLAAINAVLMHKRSAARVPTQEVVDALTALIGDSDLVLTGASLGVAGTLLRCHPETAALVSQRLLPPALQLARSPLLQGSALEALQAFFIALLQSRTPAASFESLLNALMAAGNAEDTGKVAQAGVAQCIAALCRSAGGRAVGATVESLLSVLSSAATPPGAARLALLSIGEIGRTADLGGHPTLQPALAAAAASGSEDLKTAAAAALGAVCVGNLAAYLPFVLQQVQEQAASPKDQYLFLRALNELIMSLAASSTGGQQLPPNFQAEIVNLLLGSCDAEEECRNVVAECLGHLALVAPDRVVPLLERQAGGAGASSRAAVAAAARHAIVDRPHAVDARLEGALPALFALLMDPDRHVRKAVVQLLSLAAHAKPGLVRSRLPALLPALYAQTAIDETLIRTVDLGPFKHRVDDGLELRKAAFEAMDALLDAAPEQLELPEFLTHLCSGLEDHYDVKMPCHQLLVKLAGKAPGQVLAALDALAKPLEKTLTTKLKADAVKQEVDRNEDMLRSCLRAVDACAQLPSVDTCAVFKRFLDAVVMQPPLLPKYRAVREERAEAEGRSGFEAGL